MSLKVLFAGVVAVTTSLGVHHAYLDMSGYSAEQIETELCKGHRLVEEDAGGSSQLSCSRTKVGDPIQASLTVHTVDPTKMFLLADMAGLCKRTEEPRDMGGELGCMPKPKKMAKK